MIERTDTISTADGPMGVHVVRPDGDGPFPLVVSFHHGPGLEAGSKEAMARIAGWGYVVATHDRYHRTTEWLQFDGASATDDDRTAFFGMLLGTTDEMVAADLAALLGHLTDDPAVRDGAMGCIGYCIGGRSVLRTVAADPTRFRAGVALHPSRCTTDEPDSPHLGIADYDGRLIVDFGAEDRVQPAADNQALIDLVAALPHGDVAIHAGADHGFAVPGSRAYAPAAADASYERAHTAFTGALG